VKRFTVRNMIESAAQRDMKDASVYEGALSLSASALEPNDRPLQHPTRTLIGLLCCSCSAAAVICVVW
jgi:hypothetical protein